jgi:type IV pilus assembly protein PilA
MRTASLAGLTPSVRVPAVSLGMVRMPCRGFTVIELTLVLAATAIVVALGFSAWNTHTVREQVTEGVAGARSLQDAVERSFRKLGDLPATDIAAEPTSAGRRPSRFVTSLSVDHGRIDILYGDQADAAIAARRISLTPYESAAAEIVWLCGNRIPGPGLNPLGFFGGGRQAQQIPTTVEARYLPPACR